jgi:hypothetical protein
MYFAGNSLFSLGSRSVAPRREGCLTTRGAAPGQVAPTPTPAFSPGACRPQHAASTLSAAQQETLPAHVTSRFARFPPTAAPQAARTTLRYSLLSCKRAHRVNRRALRVPSIRNTIAMKYEKYAHIKLSLNGMAYMIYVMDVSRSFLPCICRNICL